MSLTLLLNGLSHTAFLDQLRRTIDSCSCKIDAPNSLTDACINPPVSSSENLQQSLEISQGSGNETNTTKIVSSDCKAPGDDGQLTRQMSTHGEDLNDSASESLLPLDLEATQIEESAEKPMSPLRDTTPEQIQPPSETSVCESVKIVSGALTSSDALKQRNCVGNSSPILNVKNVVKNHCSSNNPSSCESINISMEVGCFLEETHLQNLSLQSKCPH